MADDQQQQPYGYGFRASVDQRQQRPSTADPQGFLPHPYPPGAANSNMYRGLRQQAFLQMPFGISEDAQNMQYRGIYPIIASDAFVPRVSAPNADTGSVWEGSSANPDFDMVDVSAAPPDFSANANLGRMNGQARGPLLDLPLMGSNGRSATFPPVGGHMMPTTGLQIGDTPYPDTFRMESSHIMPRPATRPSTAQQHPGTDYQNQLSLFGPFGAPYGMDTLVSRAPSAMSSGSSAVDCNTQSQMAANMLASTMESLDVAYTPTREVQMDFPPIQNSNDSIRPLLLQYENVTPARIAEIYRAPLRYLGSPGITDLILAFENGGQLVKVRKQLLCSRSQWFADAVEGRIKGIKANPLLIKFKSKLHLAFKLFLAWVHYDEYIPLLDEAMQTLPDINIIDLHVHAYFGAVKFESRELQQLSIENFVRISTESLAINKSLVTALREEDSSHIPPGIVSVDPAIQIQPFANALTLIWAKPASPTDPLRVEAVKLLKGNFDLVKEDMAFRALLGNNNDFHALLRHMLAEDGFVVQVLEDCLRGNSTDGFELTDEALNGI